MKTWGLANDFAVVPNQANPNPDGYGNASVWSYRQSATLAHTPAGYALLSSFDPDLAQPSACELQQQRHRRVPVRDAGAGAVGDGGSQQFTAGAGGGALSGAIRDRRANAGAAVALDGQGKAAYSTSALTVGAHTIRALFQPSGAGVEASRASLSQRVEKATTTTRLSVAPDPTVAGQKATFTATVAAATPGAGTPTGTIQFADEDGTPFGPPERLVAGTAQAVASIGAGSYNVTATYSGDAAPSTAAGFVQVVGSPAGAVVSAPAKNVPNTPAARLTAPTSSTLRTMTAPLFAGLKRRGLAALSTTAQKLAVEVPGTLTQRVYSPAEPKPAKAGTASLKLRLTAAGRRALKRARSFKLAVVMTFTPTTGKPVTTVAHVRVPARTRASGG